MADTWTDFKGRAQRIADIGIPRIASGIGVGEDEIHAFIDTETNGLGFDSTGRPAMLFEPHVFYRNLSGSKREEAVRQGLAYKRQGEHPYPKDSYPRLVQAMEIDATAALKSASWGLVQILGENHGSVGYPTVQDMVRAFMDDERAHLEAMIKFILANKIDDDLRELSRLTRPTTPEDCIGIVRVYNGAGYAKGDYHKKFARNHNKWRKVVDTPYPSTTGRAALPPDTIKKAQQRLIDLGYVEVGKVDGHLGPRTNGAISTFQGDNGLPLTGELGSTTLAKLMDVRTRPRPVSPERATATKADVKDAPEVKTGSMLQKIGAALLAFFGFGGIADGTIDFDGFLSGVTKARSIGQVLLSISPWLICLAVGGVVLIFGTRMIGQYLRQYREGRR